MSMQAFLGKLKELKLKMAELENMEDQLPQGEQEKAESAEGDGMEGLEESMGIEKQDSPEDSGEEMSDDDLMSAFGKKKKEPAKPGMKIAFAFGKSKGKMPMGKFK